MIYSENILACMAVPLLLTLFFVRDYARQFVLNFLLGMAACLLGAYVSGFLDAAHVMGAQIAVERLSTGESEPVADLVIRSSPLNGTVIEGGMIPALIDELPVIAVMAAFADGETVIRDAQELRVKESDRISVMSRYLNEMGADVTPTDDGMIIRGGKPLHEAVIDPHLDHRVAMSFAVAAAAAGCPVTIRSAQCADISCPGFYETLRGLGS